MMLKIQLEKVENDIDVDVAFTMDQDIIKIAYGKELKMEEPILNEIYNKVALEFMEIINIKKSLIELGKSLKEKNLDKYIIDNFIKNVDFESYNKKYIELLKNHYTIKELQALVTLYKDNPGIVNKMPKLAIETNNLFIEHI